MIDIRVIDKAVTSDGTEIELRDLSGEHKLPDYNGTEIIFRTIAKKTFPPNKGWYAQKGKNFIHVSAAIKIIHQIC